MSSPDTRGSYLPDIHRSLPQSLEAEKGVLCSCLLAPQTIIPLCIERIGEEFFYDPRHQLLYRVMVGLWATDKPVEFVSLTQRLKDKDLLEKAGGAAAISELFTFVPTATNADFYIDIVREKFLLRKLIEVCTNFAGRAFDEQGEVRHLLDEFEHVAIGIGTKESSQATKRLFELIPDAIARYEAAFKNKDNSSVLGLTTGFKKLDEMTGGMLNEQMIVLGAREKFGKSALAMNIATHVGLELGKPVGVFSLEMSNRQLVDRYFGSVGMVNLANLRDGSFTKHDMVKIGKAASRAKTAPIFLRTESDLTALQLRAAARNLRAQHGIELLIVDYLQLLSSETKRKNTSRQEIVAEISRNVKLCAKELRIPILVLSQLNDDGDTRESKAMQQDCDQFWRIMPMKSAKDGDDNEPDEESEKRECWLEVTLNREGGTGRIPMEFLRSFTKFQERSPATATVP